MHGTAPWRSWGPYLSERAWGTVREDYSEHGEAWSNFPHDHARSRVYRWNEDGMAGICDERQNFCFALALWNGVDPILKERMFGLTGEQGNHGEDVKEYFWYEDSTPTHSWMRWRYHYPQAAYPYQQLIDENARRDRSVGEYELVDTGIFGEDRYWSVSVDYAKAAPTDLCMVITVANRGPDDATIHVLPTLWFRNNWSWGLPDHDVVPTITASGATLVADHHRHRPAAPRRRRRTDRAGLRQRDQHRTPVGGRGTLALPEGRHQRLRRLRRTIRQPSGYGHARRPCTTCSTCRPVNPR